MLRRGVGGYRSQDYDARKETAMNIELTREQLQGTPVRVTDPETSHEYVLVRADVYDRIKRLFDEDDARLLYHGIADLDAEDWEDAAVYEEMP
jgi:hypothetical protein